LEIQPLRICHLGKFYPPATGGMETHVATLARAQAALGAEVRVICVNHLDRHGQDVTWRPLAVTPTREEWDGRVRVTRLGRRASLARLDVCLDLPGVLAGLRRSPIDLLHLQVPNPTMLLALALVRPQVPLVVTYQSDVIKQKVLRLLLRPFEHLVFRKAAMILASSPFYQEGSPLLQLYQDKVHILPLGLDLASYYAPSPRARDHACRLEAEHGKPLWLAVGRLVYYKGLHNAIAALAAVPGKLLIVGHGPLEQELKRLAAEVGVADRVIWQGRASAEELVGAYHAATAFWFTSNERSEAYGLVQIEAMASGCPVINTAIPGSGVSWVSRNNETGLTLPVNDPEALAQAALRLLNEPGLRARLSAAARARVGQEFDHLVMARRSLDFYQQVLSGVPAARQIGRMKEEDGRLKKDRADSSFILHPSSFV
jgi:glycosyltransferase involved in cell wall biosynthesis